MRLIHLVAVHYAACFAECRSSQFLAPPHRTMASTIPTAGVTLRPLGSYLLEAGLLTDAQVQVALNDQNMMDHMRFGEVVVARGWVKQQTLDYLLQKIIEPEQEAARRDSLYTALLTQKPLPPTASVPVPTSVAPSTFESLNDRKSLSSTPEDDSGVNWVG
jgi:hypothetical protein